MPRRPPPPFPDLQALLGDARRVAVVGAGSDLRGDDVAGVLVARRLAAWAAREGVRELAAFAAGAAPENFTGEIARHRPDLVVVVDAAHLGLEPGAVAVVDASKVAGVAFSTHMLPLPIFLDYLARTTGCRTLVLGIEIVQKDVLGPVSPPVERAVRRLAAAFRRRFAR
ncbi:MAG TPA: hydrogenase maturation protease [Anaeromyxobacteraceae bacterium]|nr:hydrogenase maturation protease [Anaeromyxobacteraceae bacterium]